MKDTVEKPRKAQLLTVKNVENLLLEKVSLRNTKNLVSRMLNWNVLFATKNIIKNKLTINISKNVQSSLKRME